ncbi:MAG: signal recognition particle-docking protein FtsY, partial [bacterium]
KLTKRLTGEGKTVVLAACDTFRAAAADQLAIWAERTGSDLVRGNAGADPASVAHDACQRAIAKKADYLIVDTAGRLHTQDHLMREVEKIRNVISRKIAGAPHECLLVLDATIGQNALKQADVFTKSLKCTGVILTKLDGTAKGGIVIPIRRQLGLPVKFIGVGEGADDLQPFVAREFIQAMIGE